MTDVQTLGRDWLRPYVTDGVPSTGANKPSKADGRALFDAIEAQKASALATLADAKALTTRPEALLIKSGSAAGVWDWIVGSSTTADDALVFACTTGTAGRYKRKFDGPVYALWFGIVLGTTLTQASKLQDAIDATEAGKYGTLALPAGYIRCDSQIKLGLQNPIAVSGPGVSHRYLSFADNEADDVAVLYFENLPEGDDAIVMGSALQTGDYTRDGISIANVVIARDTAETPSSGGRGIWIKGVINPRMDNVLVQGFDIGIHLDTNEGGHRATAFGRFNHVAVKYSGTVGVWAQSMVECKWDRCWFHGAANYSFHISRPASPEPGYNVLSNGNFFGECDFLGSQGTVPIHNLYADTGFFNTFNQCDFEVSTGTGLHADIGTAGGHGASRHAINLESCWFNNDAGDGCVSFDNCSFTISNTRFETGASSTDGPVRVGVGSSLGLGTYGSTIVGGGIYYQVGCGLNVETYDMLKVSGVTFYDKSASGLPAIIVASDAARNIFADNTMRTTHARGYVNNADITFGNVFDNNLLSSANTISDANYRKANGGAWRSYGGENPRTQYTGITQSGAAFAWSRYSADAGGVFQYFYKSRGATDGARGAVVAADTIKVERHYVDDGAADVEVVQVVTAADGLTGGSWEVVTKSAAGSLVRHLKVDGLGNVELGAPSLAVGATDGYAYLPALAGTATGTPTAKTGYLPMAIDTANKRLAFYAAGWFATTRNFQSAVTAPRNSVNGAGDATETANVTVTIPANIMGPNGRLRITSQWSTPGGAVTRTARVRVGGLAGTILSSTGLTGATTYREQREWANRNATNSQVAHSTGSAGGFGTGAGAIVTSAIDTTAAVDVVFSSFWAGATSGDNITLESYLIEVFYGA